MTHQNKIKQRPQLQRLLRVQDRSGRGPFQPGWSHTWTDPERSDFPPPIFEDFQNLPRLIAYAKSKNLHIGCAARAGPTFRLWFSDTEIARLRSYGFHLANATPCRVIAESYNQALFVSAQPLKNLRRVKWTL